MRRMFQRKGQMGAIAGALGDPPWAGGIGDGSDILGPRE